MKIRCLIVDDEPLAIQVIQTYAQHIKNIELIATQNVLEAYDLIADNSIDVLFLDIQMPMLTGLDFIKSLENPPLVVIITAYRDFAIESFELDVVDYLLKPVPLPRFLKAINKVTGLLNLRKKKKKKTVVPNNEKIKEDAAEQEHLFLRVDKKMVKVFLKDILYIESLKDYIRVKTKTEELIVHYTLTAITEQLPADKFMRIHRSYTVALRKVKAIDGNCVEVAGKLLPIGRNFLQETKDKLLN